MLIKELSQELLDYVTVAWGLNQYTLNDHTRILYIFSTVVFNRMISLSHVKGEINCSDSLVDRFVCWSAFRLWTFSAEVSSTTTESTGWRRCWLATLIILRLPMMRDQIDSSRWKDPWPWELVTWITSWHQRKNTPPADTTIVRHLSYPYSLLLLYILCTYLVTNFIMGVNERNNSDVWLRRRRSKRRS